MFIQIQKTLGLLSRSVIVLLALTGSLPVFSETAFNQSVYFNDFEGPVGPEWSDTNTDQTPITSQGFLGRFSNDSVTLTLNSLPAHSIVRVAFDLFIIQSWDGNVDSDVWGLDVLGGPNLINTTFSAVDCSPGPQAFPDNFPGGINPAGTDAIETNSLGYPPVGCPPGEFMDTVYHLEFTFPHTDDSITFPFFGEGLQGVSDESWGLDNVAVSVELRDVAIDIKPGSDPNSINPSSKGVIPVAILGTDSFDATQVKALSVEFGPDGAKETHGQGHVEDVDGNDVPDMVLHFKTQETGIACGEDEATLTGETFDGQSFTGTDSIKTVGCPKEKVIRIEAHIDGRSWLILRGNTAQWHHLDYAAPGRHEFRDEPTIINDATWFPVWPDVPDEENRFCDCFSDVFNLPVKPTLPKKDVSVDLDLIQSRGETEIVQYPSKENGHELIVEFDDNPIGGRDDYVVEVRFSK
jgi:hypothetical protein